MHHLKGARCYLGGPISYINYDWRSEPLDRLSQLNVHILDPYNDPKQQVLPDLFKAKEEQDEEAIIRIAKGFVRKDLGWVDRSDFILSYVPAKVPTVGTHHEIIYANDAKKPTLLVCPEGRFELSSWYWGFIPPRYIFGSWEDAFAYLAEVNAGMHMDDLRWHFVYGLI